MILSLDQVTRLHATVPVVNDVSLTLREREFFVLLGPAASGKSLLLLVIAGLVPVDHGRVLLGTRDITSLPAAQRGMGSLLQPLGLFGGLSVAGNIDLVLRARGTAQGERASRIGEALGLVGLAGQEHRLVRDLSAEGQFRAGLARALAIKPALLLLDEPLQALHGRAAEAAERLLQQVHESRALAIVLATRDPRMAMGLGQRIGIMQKGRLLETGRPVDLYQRPGTRFVASMLGPANLLLRPPPATDEPAAEQPRHRRQRTRAGRMAEAVAVLRPEDVEVAITRGSLSGTFLGQGVVEQSQFRGDHEELRIRMLEMASEAAPSASWDAVPAPVLTSARRIDATPDARPLRQGQAVMIAARRLHILPTPISSFTAYAPTKPELDALTGEYWLLQLCASMQTVMRSRLAPGMDSGEWTSTGEREPRGGVAVVHGGPGCAARVRALLARRPGPVLRLPLHCAAPKNILISAGDAETRPRVLAAAASLLRHVAGDALLLGTVQAPASDPALAAAIRELLDVRAEASELHGLDMRTELAQGEAGTVLRRELARRPGRMLVCGLTASGQLPAGLEPLLDEWPGWPVLLT
jgi:ABC-type Fe3+/spermidine/putrescine transport system ATPase subunit